MGTLANPLICQDLAAFLRMNQDVFAWSHEDMPRIDPSVIVHKLNVNSMSFLIRQKKRVFAQEQDKAIAEEVRKYTTPTGWQMWSWSRSLMESGEYASTSRISIGRAQKTVIPSLR